jgi:proteasome lid subunit RPN8/RPN11
VGLQVGERLLEQSLSTMRRCGGGRRECVLFWAARASDTSRVILVEHPAHTATRDGYSVDGNWLTQLWERMATDDTRVVAQVHTHPGVAFHSRTDDAFPALSTPGFVSVVIPRYATEDLDLGSWFVAELQEDGNWQSQPPLIVIT